MTSPSSEHPYSLGCSAQTADVNASLLPERYDPATRLDAQNVLNGTYTFYPDMDGDDDLDRVTVQVRTVQSGALAGQRILKRSDSSMPGMTGFATLMRDGRVWIWRQYEAERGTEQHQFLSLMFSTIAASEQRLRVDRVEQLAGRRVLLSRRMCNHCNGHTYSMSSGCATHYGQYSNVAADGGVNWNLRTANGLTVAQTYNTRLGVGDVDPGARASFQVPQPAAAPRRRRVAPPLMSEINPEMVM